MNYEEQQKNIISILLTQPITKFNKFILSIHNNNKWGVKH